MIVDSGGGLVWFKPVPRYDLASDFRVQTYHGKPVLTWWQGYFGAGVGSGDDVINDTAYHQIAVVRAGNGLSADLHEFEITPQRDGVGRRGVPGPLERVVDPPVDARGRVQLRRPGDRHHDRARPVPVGQPRPHPAERHLHAFPPNPERRSTTSTSTRSTRTATATSSSRRARPQRSTRSTTRPARSSGRSAASTRPSSSEPARRRPSSTTFRPLDERQPYVPAFDNGAGLYNVHRQSRALILGVDVKHKTVRKIGEFDHSPPLLASFEGNVQ